jgi:hypothetical protein
MCLMTTSPALREHAEALVGSPERVIELRDAWVSALIRCTGGRCASSI